MVRMGCAFEWLIVLLPESRAYGVFLQLHYDIVLPLLAVAMLLIFCLCVPMSKYVCFLRLRSVIDIAVVLHYLDLYKLAAVNSVAALAALSLMLLGSRVKARL